MIFHWPQYIYLILIIGGLLVSAVKHGEENKDTYNFNRSFTSAVTVLLLLYFGGFFAGATP